MSDDIDLARLEEGIVLRLRAMFGGQQSEPLPYQQAGRHREAVRQISALLANPPGEADGPEAAERAVRECVSAGWRVGLLAAQLLRALPALERAERRLRNRPETLEREWQGWQMLTRVLLEGDGSSSTSMAAFLALGEVARLDQELEASAATDPCTEASALEELVDAAAALRLEDALVQASPPLLEALAETVRRSMRDGRWDEVPIGRARYLRRWNQVCRIFAIPRSETQVVRPYLATCWLIGHNVGLMHHRAGLAAGSLLLENFDEQGSIKTFDSSDRTMSAAGDFVADLLPLRFQLWGRHLEQFNEGYLAGYEDDREAAWITLVAVDQQAIAVRNTADQERLFPTQHLQLPHFVIRAAGHLLRTDRSRRPDFAARLQAIASLRGEQQIDEATAVLVEAADLNENAARWAVEVIGNACLALTDTGEQALALSLLERSVSLAEDVVQPELLYVLRGILWTVRSDQSGGDPDRASFALQRAATWFVGARQWSWARNSYVGALSRTDDLEERGEISLRLLRMCMDAAQETGDGEYAQQATEMTIERDGLPDTLVRRLEAHMLVARSMLTPDRARRHALVREAIGLVADLPDPSGFLDVAREMVPPWEQRDPARRDPLEGLVPLETLEALYQTDPLAAMQRLRDDLAAMQADDVPMPHQLVVAGRLAAVAVNLADQMPNRREGLSRLVQELTRAYRDTLKSASYGSSDSDAPESTVANSIGWAAVNLHGSLSGDEAAGLLDDGIALLEVAVGRAPAERFPLRYSAAASNLAMAYRDRARRLDGDPSVEILQRARALMEGVLELDQQQVREGASAADVGIDIHHLNIGLICSDLADATYEAEWITEKSMESARWLRDAALHFVSAKSEALAAGAVARAGTAEMMLGYAAMTVCERYVWERSAAGGDLERAMYDWLCTASGTPHVSTADFFQLCVSTAIVAGAEAAANGLARNPSLLLESSRSLTRLWNLAERRNGLPAALARDVRMTLLERFQQAKDERLDREYASEMEGFDDLLGFLDASLQLDLVETTGDNHYLARAHERFDALTGSEDPVVRALARPRARWLDASASPSAATVGGLSLGRTPDGLVMRIPALSRSIRLDGLNPESIEVTVTPTADVRELARFATAHLRPMMDWDPLPSAMAQTKVMGRSGQTAFQLEAAALPIPTWDTWMLRLTTSESGAVQFSPSLPFLGAFEPAAGRFDDALPVSVADHTRVLLFGESGLTLHVLLAADARESDDARLLLNGEPEAPVLNASVGEVFLLVQATPRIASSQVAFLVRADDEVAGAVCSSSFSPDMPVPGMPATGAQTFSAMFPFRERVQSAALDRIRALPVSVVVMVGLPDDLDHLPDVLRSLVDPRRELLLVVDASEYPVACAVTDLVRQRVFSGLSAPLLESAASFGAYHVPLSGIQVVQASRSSAPAAVQMLLDLAAVRRVNPDDIPETIDGKPVYVTTKGNQVGMRRAETLFRSPIEFAELLARYCELAARPPIRTVLGELSAIRQQLTGVTPPRRPVLMLMPGEPLLVAAVPMARHLGAIMLFASDDGLQACAKLAPGDVYATPAAAARLPSGPWTVHEVPAEPADVAVVVQTLAARDHADLLASLPTAHPELLANRELLGEMAPASYVMLVTDAPGERAWALLAANYAAALSAPVLVVDRDAPQRDPRVEAAAGVLDGAQWRDSARDVEPESLPPPPLSPVGLDVLGAAGERLIEMTPRYVGFVTPRADFPIELVGEPPLATRYAIGRLAGPDLDSTALLIARAALAEDVPRPVSISAVVADAGMALAAKPLRGAHAEAIAIRAALARQAYVDTTFVHDDGDLFDFLTALPAAGLVHFAGHGRYDRAQPSRSGLVFKSGVFAPVGTARPLAGNPIIFSNACETGVLDIGHDAAPGSGVQLEWTGLAASFLISGAANYLGSLWPIYDDSSRALAEEFYELLCAGVPVGEALRRARLEIHTAGDPTWAAFVLFGCPRNRIRPSRQKWERVE